jgi:ABC-type transport system, involved in lipoprotein release, permease component
MRTVLTGLSVSWGIFILIVLLGSGNGLKNGVTSNFSNRASNTVRLWSGDTSMPYKGLKTERSLRFMEKELQALDKLEEVGGLTGLIGLSPNIVLSYKNEYGNFTIRGVSPINENIFALEFAPGDGRFINELDIKNLNKVIVLDKAIVEVLFKNENPIGKNVKLGNVMFKVVGVNSKKARWGNGEAYIPFTTAQKIYNSSKKFGMIAFLANDLKTEEENDAFEQKLRTTLGSTMQFDPEDKQALWINSSQRDYIETMKIFGGINFFVSIIGIFTLIAGIVGVSNIMLVTVKERTREIGIRKAIGASPANILRSIIIESIIITAIFGYIGMIAGVGLTEIVNFFMEQAAAGSPDGMSVFKNPTVGLDYVFTATAILILAGVIAGYMPARRAVKIKPIEAMRE